MSVNRNQAFAEGKRRWGVKAGVEDSGEKAASSPEERNKAQATFRALDVELKVKEQARDKLLAKTEKLFPTRAREMNKAVWQSYRNEVRDLRKERENQAGMSRRYRYRVGPVESVGGLGMFHVMGEGDSWEEAFQAADKK